MKRLDSGCWILAGLHHSKITVNGVPTMSMGSAVDYVNDYTDTYPYLV